MTGLSVGICLQDRPVQHRCRRSVHAWVRYGALYVRPSCSRCPGIVCHAGSHHAGRRIWGAIPGFFKAYFNVNEVITSIMFNWIGLYRGKRTGATRTAPAHDADRRLRNSRDPEPEQEPGLADASSIACPELGLNKRVPDQLAPPLASSWPRSVAILDLGGAEQDHLRL